MGEGGDGAVGQVLDAKADKWRWYSDKNVIRSYDFEAKGFRTQRTRGEGNVPPGGGFGTTTPAPTQEQNTVTMANNFNAQVEMAMTPVGFLKAAAENNATMSTRTEKGKKYTVLSFPMESGAGAAAYKTTVNGFIDDKGMVQKVETTINENFLGDVKWEATFSNWKDFGGVKFPTSIVQRQFGPMVFELNVTDVKVNQPVDLTQQAKGGGKGAPGGAPGGGKGAPGGGKGGDLKALPQAAEGKAKGGPGAGKGGPAVVDSEDLGGGFWLVRGGYGSVIADFKDYVILIEGPSGDARIEQILAEAKRLVPNKPIRYVINTHPHFDHTQGLRALTAEGVTVVTHQNNKGFFEKAIANPHTLVPDKMQKSNPKAKVKIEYVGDKKVYTDGTHTIETHYLRGSTHSTGNLLVYLPKQKILLEADEFNVPNQVRTAPPAVINGYQTNLLAEVERLKLDVARIIPVHLPGDNRAVAFAELKMEAGKP
jgi:glyoxylase-like metal-dependent hydrolase (beta-lactamase superfamily II)